jgi:hypothetical protein
VDPADRYAEDRLLLGRVIGHDDLLIGQEQNASGVVPAATPVCIVPRQEHTGAQFFGLAQSGELRRDVGQFANRERENVLVGQQLISVPGVAQYAPLLRLV